jgi:hypothetical protein
VSYEGAYLLKRFPRATRSVLLVVTAGAASVAVFDSSHPVAERVLGAAFYGVVTWLLAVSLRELSTGRQRPDRQVSIPLPGAWRPRRYAKGDVVGVVVPLHGVPIQKALWRGFAICLVLVAIGFYVGVTGHAVHGTADRVIATAICAVLGLPVVVATLVVLYRVNPRRQALVLTPDGIGFTGAEMVRWNEVSDVDIAPGRGSAALLTIHGRGARRASVDVSRVDNLAGVLTVVNTYRHDATHRTALGSPEELARVRRLRRSSPTRASTSSA